MKNLMEELRNLDEYEYKVSANFSKKVMRNIKKSKTANRFSNVISLASIGVVACLAVVLFSNSNIKSNFLNFADKDSAENLKENQAVNSATSYYDVNGVSAENEKELFNTYKENSEFEGLYNDNGNLYNNLVSESLPEKNEMESLKGNTAPNSTGILADGSFENEKNYDNYSEDLESVNRNDSANKFIIEKDIIKILEDAKLNPENTDDGIKVKATKEKVEDLLKDYDIAIETIDEYIVIKLN